MDADVTIIGAGAVGLAIASEVSKKNKGIFVIEKNSSFGQETSSRNSEVIHAGIYYKPSSLKAKLCIEGSRMLYSLCKKKGIAHRKTGKLIVATEESEEKQLEDLMQNAIDSGARGISLITKKRIAQIEPNIKAMAALLSTETGIIDSHHLMLAYLAEATGNGAGILYRTKVTALEPIAGGLRVAVDSPAGKYDITSRIVINSAGLASDEIAAMAGIDIDLKGYRLHYCKGDYFNVSRKKSGLISRLVYPVPKAEGGSLGIHATIDLTGQMKLGPDTDYLHGRKISYKIDEGKKGIFFNSCKRFLPFLELDDLSPGMSGIRPRLKSETDFIIRHEKDNGLAGLINLIGIESPGLTASPAIARLVGQNIAAAC
ncbi:MAG: NAD(P)/FAD-dependent oxidoreductase [Candidatus Woesearchaeota archaeon]